MLGSCPLQVTVTLSKLQHIFQLGYSTRISYTAFYPRPFSLSLCPFQSLLEIFLSQTNCCLPDYKTLSNLIPFELEEFSERREIQFWYTNNIENQEYLDYAIIEAQDFAHTSSCYSLYMQIIKKSSTNCSVQKKPVKIMRSYREVIRGTAEVPWGHSFSLEETDRRPHHSLPFPHEGKGGTDTVLFLVTGSNRNQGNGMKLCHGEV